MFIAVLPVFTKQLEVRLGVVTGRTLFRSLSSFIQIATVTASPGNFLITLKNLVGLDICHQILVTFLMLLFRNSNGLKDKRYLLKILFTGSDGKFRDMVVCS